MSGIGMSKCCGAVLLREPIFLNVKRTDGTTGRREIAEVAFCVGCKKPVGDVRSLRSPKLAAEEWAELLGVKKDPPFYFNDVGGQLVPDGLDLATFQQKKIIQPGRQFSLSAQDRAANEEQPEYEPE